MITGPKLTLPDDERDHIQGSIDAPIALLEYGDYECPACGQTHPIVKAIQQQFGDDLCFAAEAAEAAGNRGNFWGMHDLLFENQDALEDEALAEYAAALGLDHVRLIREVLSGAYAGRVREDFKSGVRAGVNGTPTFFINGQRYDGARSLEPLLAAMKQRSGHYVIL